MDKCQAMRTESLQWKKHRSNPLKTSKPLKAQELAVQGVFESEGVDGAENRIVC